MSEAGYRPSDLVVFGQKIVSIFQKCQSRVLDTNPGDTVLHDFLLACAGGVHVGALPLRCPASDPWPPAELGSASASRRDLFYGVDDRTTHQETTSTHKKVEIQKAHTSAKMCQFRLKLHQST